MPHSFLLAESGGELVGRASIRHTVNDVLMARGGHIGYGVLSRYRGRGHATRILRLSLVVARAHGVDRALVTCDDGNAASAAVIERCGGVLDPEWPLSNMDGTAMRRYWIA